MSVKTAMIAAIQEVQKDAYFGGYDITAEQVWTGLKVWKTTLGEEFDDGYNPSYDRGLKRELGIDYVNHANGHRTSITVVINSFAEELFAE